MGCHSASTDVQRVTPGFTRHSWSGEAPVLLSVPHAGRDYPSDIADRLTVPLRRVRALEDLYADRLADVVIARGGSVLIARTPRLIVDLNRAETDFDATEFSGSTSCGPISPKARGGLGVVPTRLAGVGQLWREPVTAQELSHRLAQHHRPYHAALANELATIHKKCGTAVLIDLHSMPGLSGAAAAQIVVGTRNRTTAPPALVALVQKVLVQHRLRHAIDAPYPGGHIVARHADPENCTFALQIEVDRRLYLDHRLESPGEGLHAVQSMVADLIDAIASWLLIRRLPVAAE